MNSAWLWVLLALLMAISAVISASETAFFSLRPWRIDRLRREHPVRGPRIAEALRDPRVFVVTVIIGTELINIASSNIVAILQRQLAVPSMPRGVVLAAGVAATSIALLMLCDMLPKSMAVAFPEAVALRMAPVFNLLLLVVRPIAMPLARFTSFLTEPRRRGAPSASGPAPLSEEDFRTLVDISRREGILKQSQTDMIEAAFRLGDLQVRQVMAPRPDIVAIEESATLEEAVALVREHRHSRVPVFKGSLDEITGVLYAKDLLSRRFGLAPPAARAGDIARPALFVPEVMRARQLVHELQARQVHLAIVVDEYGGTAGVVTLEDLLEEMMGEFADEFERPIRVFRPLKQRGTFWVRASMPLPEFNRRVRARIKAQGVDTVGGYVLKLFGRVPSEGDTVSDGQFVFSVRQMIRRRIVVVHVERRRELEEKSDRADVSPEGGQSSPPGASG